MGLLKKLRCLFNDDICSKCGGTNDQTFKQLYLLDQMVGHYVCHEDANYYKKNIIKVEKKSDIPTGMYACGIIEYTCRNCNNKIVKLSVFLPVRDQEKYEEYIYFKNGELDEFLNQ